LIKPAKWSWQLANEAPDIVQTVKVMHSELVFGGQNASFGHEKKKK
jgi:hypothetical protein